MLLLKIFEYVLLFYYLAVKKYRVFRDNLINFMFLCFYALELRTLFYTLDEL